MSYKWVRRSLSNSRSCSSKFEFVSECTMLMFMHIFKPIIPGLFILQAELQMQDVRNVVVHNLSVRSSIFSGIILFPFTSQKKKKKEHIKLQTFGLWCFCTPNLEGNLITKWLQSTLYMLPFEIVIVIVTIVVVVVVLFLGKENQLML